MKCSASSLLNKNNYDSGKLVIAYFPFTLNLSGKGGGRGEGRRGKFTIYINAEKSSAAKTVF